MATVQRLAAISDIHGNLLALQAVLDDIQREGVDLVVNLGDIVSGPLWPAETAALLRRLDFPTLRGNHERQLLAPISPTMGAADAHARARLTDADLHWLASLPATLDVGGGLWCCHGTPDSDVEYFLETVTDDLGREGSPGVRAATMAEARQRLGQVDAAVVLCGHTHMPRSMTCGATLIVNPGSVGLQAFDDDHPFEHRMATGSPHARWALIERAEGGWRSSECRVEYDWRGAALRAEEHGRGDWADALRTGRVGRLEREVLGLGAGHDPAAGRAAP